MASDLGTWGEDQAARFLSAKGYFILERNFRVPEGEIDLIAERAGVLVFVEVKTRASKSFGFPEEALSTSKQARLLHAGFRYLDMRADRQDDFRFDLIAIECTRDRRLSRVDHLEDVIRMDALE